MLVDLFTDEVGLSRLIDLCKNLDFEINRIYLVRKKFFEIVKNEDIEMVRTNIEIFEEIEDLFSTKAEIGICFSFGKVIKKHILKGYKYGILNFHTGRLPLYRGANTINWMVINGEKETQMSLHLMDEQIDHGPIISTQDFEIKVDETSRELLQRMSMGVPSFAPDIKEYIDGKIEPRPQNDQFAQYWPRRKPEDGFFDWKMSDIDIHNLIRALVRPWPGAFYKNKNGETIRIQEYWDLEKIRRTRKNEET